MRPFECACGARIFFDNVRCLACERELGFIPELQALATLEPTGDGTFQAQLSQGLLYKKCQNYSLEGVCTWMLPANDSQAFCRACRLNQIVPDLSAPENRVRWARIEGAKRRLIYTIDRLGLELLDKSADPEHGLAFEFKADAEGALVLTGHDDGVITLKIDEADPVLREQARVNLHERYRSLLGHFRHEIGHYYFEHLVSGPAVLARFRELFGDERQDYAEALKRHYAGGAKRDESDNFISIYAQAHPHEDWAESFAHYLHMVDTLETADSFGKLQPSDPKLPIVDRWLELTVVLNALTRSMGLEDAYPFAIGDGARQKLEFVQQLIERKDRVRPGAGTAKSQPSPQAQAVHSADQP